MKNEIKKKIIIGTAQFDKDYGKLFRQPQSHKKQINKMLNYALSKNLNYVDSAINYKNSKYLSKFNNNFKIITKLPKLPKNKNYDKWMENLIKKNLEDLNVKKFYAVLFHNNDFLKDLKKKRIISAIKKLKKKKLCQKIGISIYEKQEIKKHLNIWKPDIIELPYNILDGRLDDSYLKKLKKRKILIFARSIFLKGLILNTSNDKFFNKWKKIITEWKNWCLKNKLSRLEVSLNYVIQKPFIDKLIIGVDNVKDLREILATKIRKKIKLPNLKSRDRNLVNPHNWKMK